MKQILTLIVLLILSAIQEPVNAQSAAQKRVLVYFRTGVQRNAPPNQNTVTITSSNVTQVLNTYGLNTSNVTSSFPNFNEADTVDTEIGESSRQMDYAKVFAISLPDTSFKSSLINSLLNLSEVLYAESDGKDTTDLIPVDGRFGDQWNLHNAIVPNADIHAEAAWDIFTGNPNSIIAVIDAGVDVNHNDLAAKIDGGDNTFDIGHDPIVGDFSHGSHVAGIAAAVTNNNNNNGVAGVDWQARIHPRNVINPTSGDAQITDAINESLNFSSNVWTFNNSWETLPHGRYSVTVRSAFANVYRNNRVQCIAMGNNHIGAAGTDDPANFPVGINSGIIAVGATDINDGVAGFSNRGQHIDVSAPGVNIISTNFNNGYVALSGTSMATPHVSGLASLLKGFNTNLANDDIEQIIRLTADDANGVTNPGFDNQMGAGRINALKALQSLQAPNTLQHLSTTGGTVFSTSGNMTRIFLGVPGFADAAYIVKRSEIRKAITLPTMCNTIGVWGRGISTTGYREENGRCFGEGFCEVVPGTLTSTGCTLRTYIYEVWTTLGQYIGFYPSNATNAVLQYSILGVSSPSSINGDNSFCTTSNSFNIPSLPAGATVHWDVTPAGIATPNTLNSTQTTLTKNADGIITLTATISNACGGSITVTKKNITVGIPTFGIIADVPCQPGRIVQLSTFTVSPVSNAPTTYHWRAVQNGMSTTIIGSGSTVSKKFPLGGPYQVYSWGQNACGFSDEAVVNFQVVSCPNSLQDSITMMVSPNPATNTLTVEVNKKNQRTSEPQHIEMIELVDKIGNLRLRKQIGQGISKISLNVSQIPNDIYTLRVFDGVKWTSYKIMIQH